MICYKHSTGFGIVKLVTNTYKPNFYKLSTVFVAVKTRLTNHQVFNKPCDGQNRVADHQQSFNYI